MRLLLWSAIHFGALGLLWIVFTFLEPIHPAYVYAIGVTVGLFGGLMLANWAAERGW